MDTLDRRDTHERKQAKRVPVIQEGPFPTTTATGAARGSCRSTGQHGAAAPAPRGSPAAGARGAVQDHARKLRPDGLCIDLRAVRPGHLDIFHGERGVRAVRMRGAPDALLGR
jgi:hypothetical protein